VPVYFGKDSSDISVYTAEVLKDHASLLSSHPDVKVTIVGSTDDVGNHEENVKMAMRRAQAAYRYLVSLGVPANRMTCKNAEDIRPLLGESPKRWKNSAPCLREPSVRETISSPEAEGGRADATELTIGERYE
jgi:flagellar motor protein MotB